MNGVYSFGRSANIGTLQAGEAAIFFDRTSKQYGLAFCATVPNSEDGGKGEQIVAHSFHADQPVLVFICAEHWRRIPAWVLPRTASIQLDFRSRIAGSAMNTDAPWSYIFLDDQGQLQIPVFNPLFSASDHQGWINPATGSFQPKPGLSDHDFQCFTRWGIYLAQGADNVAIWTNDFACQPALVNA